MADKRLTSRQRFWLEHLENWSQSGESLSGYAKRHGLRSQNLYVAKGRLKAQGLWPHEGGEVEHSQFVRVRVRAVTASTTTCQVHLPNGARVEVSVGDGELAGVLRAAAAL